MYKKIPKLLHKIITNKKRISRIQRNGQIGQNKEVCVFYL